MLNITVKNSRLSAIIDVDQELKEIVSECGKIRGMIWNERAGHLTFNDETNSCMYRWSQAKGKTLLKAHMNKAIGNVYDWMGRIYTCESETGNIVMMNDDATEYSVEIKGFDRPNKITMMSNGELYITDSRGVYMTYPIYAEPVRIIDDIGNPMEVCFSVDERKVYVTDQGAKKVWYYDLALDGTVATKRMFATTSDFGSEGGPDSIRVDTNDNVWIAAQKGVYVYDKGGILLGIINLPEDCTSICFGMYALQTIFIACNGKIYTLSVNMSGQRLRW